MLLVSLLQRLGFHSDPQSTPLAVASLQSRPTPGPLRAGRPAVRAEADNGIAVRRKRGITTPLPVVTEHGDALWGLAQSSAQPQEQVLSGIERSHLVKAPATPTAKKKKPAPSAAKERSSAVVSTARSTAKPSDKSAVKVVAKSGTKATSKKTTSAKSPPVVKKSASTGQEKPTARKVAAKAAAKPTVAKALPKKTAPAALQKSSKVSGVPVLKKAVAAPLKVVASAKKAPPVVAPVPKSSASGGKKISPIVVEPTPRPLGKRAAKKVMMEQMTQAAVVPTHAPDAAKATFSLSNERVMTPPVPSSVKKDPKRANNWKSLSIEQLNDQDVLAMPDGEYMNDVQLAYFRHKLSVLRADMLANAGETTEHLREDTVVVPDPADRATIEEEHALELRTRDRERKLLKKIEQAIARIDSGDYGYCEETGEAIGVGRLMARPTASLSLEAQQRRELKQKMFGD